MYIKIKGNITDFIPDNVARGDMREAGFIVYGYNQLTINGDIISYGKVTDIDLINQYLPNPNVTLFNTIDEVNADMENNYVETYSITNLQEVMFDLQMRGNPEIPNYDKTKPLTSQDNLKAMHDFQVSGVTKSKKQAYIE